MDAVNSILHVVPIVVSAQGLIISFILLRSARFKSQKFLAGFTGLFSLHIFINSPLGLDLLDAFPVFIIPAVGIPFLLVSLVYLYLSAGFYGRLVINPYPLLIPYFFSALFFFLLFLMRGGGFFQSVLLGLRAGQSPVFMMIHQSAVFLWALFILYKIVRLFIFFRAEWKHLRGGKKQAKFLKNIILPFGLSLAIAFALLLIINSGFVEELDVSTLVLIQNLAYSVILTYCVILTYKLPIFFKAERARTKIRQSLNLSSQEEMRLTDRIDAHIKKNKPYLDPSYSMADLSTELSVHSNILSYVINEKMKVNFSQYIARHRLEEFLSLVRSGKMSSQTMLALALDAGFNSKASFNRAFKNHYGRTPSEYIGEMKPKIEPGDDIQE